MQVLALFVGVGMLLVGALLTMTALTGLSQGVDATGAFLLGFFGIVTLAGVLLIEFSSPGIWKRIGAEAGRGLMTPATLLNPAAHGALLFALGVAAAWLWPLDPAVPVFGATLLYAVASPLAIAIRPGWKMHAALSACGMLVLLTLFPMAAAAAARHSPPGETSRIMIVPMLVFPIALALSGVTRSKLARRAEAAAAQRHGD